MKVEALARGVGGEEQACVAANELPEHLLPLAGGHSSMQQHRREIAQQMSQLMQSLAVLREHDCRFARSAE